MNQLAGEPGEPLDDRLPPGWWGPVWTRPHRRSLTQLVHSGLLDVEGAALLRLLVSDGVSVTIAAGPSGAGKTTLLTALLRDVPADRHAVFTRGFHHPVADIDRYGEQTTLIVNEISPHLPIYAWGEVLRAILRAGQRGAQILATTHAETPEDLVFQFASYPLRLPAMLIAPINVVAFIDVEERDGRRERRLGLAARLSGSRDGVRIEPVRLVSGGPFDWNTISMMVGQEAEDRHRAYVKTIEQEIAAERAR